MATALQILANRENAQHSTGPRTDAGKSRSAANATRHGLTGGFSVLASESQAEFDQLLAAYTQEFQPSGPHQSFLVAQLAQSRWRLARIDRLETEALDSGDPGSVPASLNLFSRYRSAAERSYHKAHRELMDARRHPVALHAPAGNQDNIARLQQRVALERELLHYAKAILPSRRNKAKLTPERVTAIQKHREYITARISPSRRQAA